MISKLVNFTKIQRYCKILSWTIKNPHFDVFSNSCFSKALKTNMTFEVSKNSHICKKQ